MTMTKYFHILLKIVCALNRSIDSINIHKIVGSEDFCTRLKLISSAPSALITGRENGGISSTIWINHNSSNAALGNWISFSLKA